MNRNDRTSLRIQVNPKVNPMLSRINLNTRMNRGNHPCIAIPWDVFCIWESLGTFALCIGGDEMKATETHTPRRIRRSCTERFFGYDSLFRKHNRERGPSRDIILPMETSDTKKTLTRGKFHFITKCFADLILPSLNKIHKSPNCICHRLS